ncbi:MAG: ribonuclease HII [Gemmatimonadota bacterium]
MSRRRAVGRCTVRYLLDDPRAGVQALGRRYLAVIRARERERNRLTKLIETERELAGDRSVVAGVDGLDDSKRLDPSRRERLDGAIRADAIAVGVGAVSERMIDRINIYQASLMAMRLALEQLDRQVDLALLDGRPPRAFPVPHKAIVGGDGRVRSIAAASIIAKVARDRLLIEADRRWPEYGFARHKGYMTPEHIRALRKHGVTPIHRLSFPRVWAEADAMGPLYRDIEAQLAKADTTSTLEAAEFALDAARASLHASEERLLQRLLESRREKVLFLQRSE